MSTVGRVHGLGCGEGGVCVCYAYHTRVWEGVGREERAKRSASLASKNRSTIIRSP